MASELLNTLEKIDSGRKELINKANEKGFNLPPNAGLHQIASTLSFPTKPSVDPPEYYKDRWTRPTYWPETKQLLDMPEKDGMTPRYVLLCDDVSDTITIPKSQTTLSGGKLTGTLNGSGYLLSDGTWYTDTSNDIVHEWDRSKDITLDGIHFYRYVVVYLTTNEEFIYIYLNNTSARNALEIVLGDVQCKHYYTNGTIATNPNGFNINGCRKLQSIRSNTNHMIEQLPVGSILSCNDLRYVEWDNVEALEYTRQYIPDDYGTYVSAASLFSSSDNLETFIMRNLKYIYCRNSSNRASSLLDCDYLTYVDLPKLEELDLSYSTSTPATTLHNFLRTSTSTLQKSYINLPSLKKIHSFRIRIFEGYTNLDSLEEMTDSELYLYPKNQIFTLPKLKRFIKKHSTGTGTLFLYSKNSYLEFPLLEEVYKIDCTNARSIISFPSLVTAYSIGRSSGSTFTDPDTGGSSTNTKYPFNSKFLFPCLKTCENFYSLYSYGEEYDLPGIEHIETGAFGDLHHDYFKLPESLKAIPKNCLTRAMYLIYLDIKNDFDLTGLNLTECTKLNRKCLRDILSRLKDVTSDTANTYEITFGETNIAKLTTEEWQVAIDKGWVITDLVEEASE